MIRTRFAPSPTGYLHIGGLRTALYSYLFAKHHKGTFIIRIEDTDQKRYVEGSLENLLRTFAWAGLEADEGPYLKDNKVIQKGDFGPYIQSERTEIYRKHAEILVEKGAAYPCFCTSERLDEMRAKQEASKLAPMYDRTCLKLKPEEIDAKKNSGIPFVIRQNIPRRQTLKFHDNIRGNLSFDTNTIDDQVLMKSDNFPTYHLANVVDDHFMEISHVIRGEEWLPSAPKHVMLYQAFGWTPPEFAHIPLLLNKDKTKLSKRQGDVSVEDYITKGYSKEAILNFIALLGWHPGQGVEQEIFSVDELVEKFSLEQVHKSGAIFDVEKLNWFNFQWSKKVFIEELEKIAKKIDKNVRIELNEKKEKTFTFDDAKNAQKFMDERAQMLLQKTESHIDKKWLDSKEKLMKALLTVEEKILKNPNEIKENIQFYFEQKSLDKNLLINEKMKVDNEISKNAIQESIQELKNLEDWSTQEPIKNALLNVVTKLALKNGQIFWPVRVALTSEQFSPGVFEVIWALGKEETLKRLEKAIQ